MIYTIVRKNDNDKIDAIISFDSITSMDESWNATVTSQTVEYGFNISDNTNIESPTYNISSTISSYSLFRKDREITWNGEEFKTESEPNLNYHIEVREQLIKVFSDRKLVTLIESSVNSDSTNDKVKVEELKSGYFKEIDDCIITSLSFSHPDTGSGAIKADIKLQKIVMANVAITELAEGEKRALLRELPVNFEPYSGKSKKEEGLIDPTTGLPAEDGSTPIQKGNRDEMEKIMREKLGINDDKEYLEAVQRATQAVSITRKTHTVVKAGNSYRVIQGRNAAALLTIDGVTD